MSEQLRHRDSGETLKLDAAVQKNLERAQEEAKETKEIADDQIEQIRRSIEQKAVSGQEITVGEREAAPSSDSFGTHKQLKALSYKRTLSHVQSRLGGPDRALSKVIHKPAVERLSNIGAQTIARPASLLTAGLVALFGSVFTLYLAKHYGFTYSYSFFVVLLVGGYLLGLVIELFAKFLKRRP